MTTEKIKERLCYYDDRNPYYIKTLNERIVSKDTYCTCNSCWNGTHELANELLKVKEELKQFKNDFKLIGKIMLG